jgi:hypothetical protein
MQRQSWWSTPTSDTEAHARAAGRRRYNALRRDQAAIRRIKVLQLIADSGGFHRGVQAAIARRLGVSPATISRDVAGILRPQKGDRDRCPFCGCRGHVVDGRVEPFDPAGLTGFTDTLLDDLDRLSRPDQQENP